MTRQPDEVCPLCGSEDVELLTDPKVVEELEVEEYRKKGRRKRDRYLQIHAHYMLRCNDCGHSFTGQSRLR